MNLFLTTCPHRPPRQTHIFFLVLKGVQELCMLLQHILFMFYIGDDLVFAMP